jgi:glycosyltransferase involved in cell wall biosynthesis
VKSLVEQKEGRRVEGSPQQARLALVSHRFQRNDGQGRVNYEIARAALDHGFAVTILATHCADEIANHPRARFVRIGYDRLPTELLRNLAFAWSSAQWIKHHRNELDMIQGNGFVTWERCDIVAAHFVHTAWRKSPYYPFTSFSPYSLYQRLYTFLNSGWERKAFFGAARVIAVSRGVARELSTLGVPPEQIDVIYNGVDTDQFYPGDSDRAAFGLPAHVPLALFVGDIRTPRKNLDTVLRALQHAPEIHLAVAGSVKGSPYPLLARELGISDRVFFLDKVSGIPSLMRAVDLFVFPSRYEAHPLVVLEAMASGLPTIVSGNFGAEEFLGDAGEILKDPNDADALARVMNDLVRSPEKRRSMALAGRQRALAMRWSTMARTYLDVYEKVLRVGSEVVS